MRDVRIDIELNPSSAGYRDFLRHYGERMRLLYGLSPAEARFLQGFLATCDVKLTTQSLGLTENSGRCLLKVLFRKTGTCKQAELVRLALLTSRPLPASMDLPTGTGRAPR